MDRIENFESKPRLFSRKNQYLNGPNGKKYCWHYAEDPSPQLAHLHAQPQAPRIPSDLRVRISRREYFHGPVREFHQRLGDLCLRLFVGIMWLCLIISPKHGISIIKVFQMADYLLFFNADTPSNLAAFMIIFSSTPFDSIPNPFEYFQATRGGTCSPPQKFEQNEVSCYILANIGSYVLQLAGMLL
jgi:hypothetical protein